MRETSEETTHEEALGDPFAPSSTSGNAIRIDFVPGDSTKVTTCDQIVDIQFVRLLADGNPILPGTYYSGWAYRDAVATDQLRWVDFLNGETTPDYQQGGTAGQVGFKKSSGERNAWIPDAPTTSGGDKGFKTPSNPTGWDEVVYEFRTFCWCMQGDQCGSWYEGLSWQYKKTAHDYAVGSPGASTILDRDLTAIGAELLAAFDKFNLHFHFVPCSTTATAGGGR